MQQYCRNDSFFGYEYDRQSAKTIKPIGTDSKVTYRDAGMSINQSPCALAEKNVSRDKNTV